MQRTVAGEGGKRPRGRPAGRVYPHNRNVRLADRDLARLDALAAQLDLPESGVVRLALEVLAKKHKVMG